jgi:spermidine/putrescine transport system permease protein
VSVRLRYRLPGALLWVVFGTILVFLYVPIMFVVVFSFDTNPIMSWPPSGVTLDWYRDFFADGQLIASVANSVKVAVASIGIGLFLGIPGAFGLDRMRFAGKAAFEKLLILPFVVPGVIGGVTLLSLFLTLGVQLSLKTVIAAHATLVTAAVLLQTSVGLKRWDRTLELAAMDLGANELRTFFSVTLPNLRNTIVGAVLLGTTLSLDEITRTFFLTGTDNTLPMQVWSMLRQGITPEINAVASLLFAVSVALLAIWTFTVRDERAL